MTGMGNEFPERHGKGSSSYNEIDLPGYHSETMNQVPQIQTDRLLLRAFATADAEVVQRLAGAWAIADTTRSIPHPYPDGAAEAWIRSHPRSFATGALHSFAITIQASGELTGAISLMNPVTDVGLMEIGYWIGVEYWRRGYCTEAARAVVNYGFTVLGLKRIHGHCLKRNPASGRVMEKLGMTREGCLRQHMSKWDKLEDVLIYGILRSEWNPVTNV